MNDPELDEMGQLIDEWLATTSYNITGDWRKEPLTAIDPDEEPAPAPMSRKPEIAKD